MSSTAAAGLTTCWYSSGKALAYRLTSPSARSSMRLYRMVLSCSCQESVTALIAASTVPLSTDRKRVAAVRYSCRTTAPVRPISRRQST